MLNEIKSEVDHAKKDYYVGMPILSLKEIEWLIVQAEQTRFWKQRFFDENKKLLDMIYEKTMETKL